MMGKLVQVGFIPRSELPDSSDLYTYFSFSKENRTVIVKKASEKKINKNIIFSINLPSCLLDLILSQLPTPECFLKRERETETQKESMKTNYTSVMISFMCQFS